MRPQGAERLDDRRDVDAERIVRPLDLSHVGARNLRVVALVVDVEQLAARRAAEEQSVAADELQRVPLWRIVAGRDGHAATGAQLADEQLHGRRRADPEVDDTAAAQSSPAITACATISPEVRVSRPMTTRPPPT